MTTGKTAGHFGLWATTYFSGKKKPQPPPSRPKDGKPPTEFVVAHLEGIFGMPLTDIMRRRGNGRPPDRYSLQVKSYAIWLATEVTADSLTEIGLAFGYKDHTTAMYFRDRVRKQIKSGYDKDRLEAAKLTIRISWEQFIKNGAS
jgi:hypothetical protein